MNDKLLANLYIIAAAAAGSIVALYSMEWRKMGPSEIAFAWFVGFVVAIFAVPYVAAHWLSLDMRNPREACGVTFIGATVWNSIMPLAIRKLKKLLGLEEDKA